MSKKGLDDSGLNELVSKLPSRSLALMEDIDAAFFHGLSRKDAFSQPEWSTPAQPSGADDQITPGSAYTPHGARTGGSSVTLSGLLSAIDGVTAQEGRLLFATTNRYSALDPALVRPGRLDVHVRFDNAESAQIEELFRCFFLPSIASGCDDEETCQGDDTYGSCDEEYATGSESSEEDLQEKEKSDQNPGNLLSIERWRSFLTDIGSSAICRVGSITGTLRPPKLTKKQVNRLAKSFAARVPEREFSMASIQGLLMQYKTRPRAVIKAVKGWIENERRKKAEREGKPIVMSPVIDEKRIDDMHLQAPDPVEGIAEVCTVTISTMWWPLGMI